MRLGQMYDTRLPGQLYFGAMPDSVAVSEDGKAYLCCQLRIGCYSRLSTLRPFTAKSAHSVKALGFVPTEWYPTEVAVRGNNLYVATAKGLGTGPNNGPQKQVAGQKAKEGRTYLYRNAFIWILAMMDLWKRRKTSPTLRSKPSPAIGCQRRLQHITSFAAARIRFAT